VPPAVTTTSVVDETGTSASWTVWSKVQGTAVSLTKKDAMQRLREAARRPDRASSSQSTSIQPAYITVTRTRPLFLDEQLTAVRDSRRSLWICLDRHPHPSSR